MTTHDYALHIDHATIGLADDRDILYDIDLCLPRGECHVIMGPNGAGKSSLLQAVMGLSPYELRQGHIHYDGIICDNVAVEERANKGLFMSFQSPVAIPGVSNVAFYKAIIQHNRSYRGLGPLSSADFMALVRGYCLKVGLPESFLYRDVNDDFSGGERKRNELLHMLLLQPQVVMLDEVDSGVDVDAIGNFVDIIHEQRTKHNTSFLIITHYHRFLDALDVDAIHVVLGGKKVATGGQDIVREIDAHGFKAWA